MTIIMFAIIGSAIKAKAAYWICYGVFCALKVIKLIIDLCKD